MGDIFENDIDNENENLAALEDSAYETEDNNDGFTFDKPLYHLKLMYSCESVYAASSNIGALNAGESVIVPTRYGKDLAVVLGQTKNPIGVKTSEIVEVDRRASKDDLERVETLKKKEADAFVIFKEKVTSHHLDMKLISVHFLLDEQKALFFFSSDNRVDFRELVKDLVSVFKMRIELRQIGVRDESRITGGLGVCGRPYCCHSVSDKLRPVSIRMAKDQNLSLNSMKISGQCGRLLCCLSYEFDWYNEARKSLPSEGIRLFYDGTNFKITEVNPITSMVKLLGEDGRLLEVNAKRFNKDSSGHWKIS
jgi:cell fate regulator YaaT (PSP1 superfamily)